MQIFYSPFSDAAAKLDTLYRPVSGLRSKQKVTWDAANKKLTDEKLNQEYFKAHYHNGYTVPKV